MKRSSYVGEEFKRIFGRKSVLISVIVLLLVPLVYAMIMLSPKWGPQDNIDNLPVAVVNNDLGAESEGEPVNIGNELMSSLDEERTLGWDFVSSEAAQKGMDDMKYYMTIEVPEDFSIKALTVLDDNPEKPELKFTQNEGLHYMAATVTNQAKDTIQGQLSSQITETYVQTVVDKLGGVADGFTEAADGASDISDGSGELKDGSEEMLLSLIGKYPDITRLAEGAGELDDGTKTLKGSLVSKQGDISELAAGSKELNEGTKTLKGSLVSKQGDISELAAGSKELNEGTKTLKGSLVSKQGDISELAKGSKELNEGTGELLGNLNNKSSDIFDLAAGAKEVNSGTNLLLNTLNEKSSDISELNDGANELAGGAKQISEGAKEINAGASELKKGSSELATGAESAKAGSSALKAGLDNQLVPGSKELAAGVAEAQQGVNETIASMGDLQESLNTLAGMDKENPLYDVILNETLKELNASLEEAPQKQADFKRLTQGANTLRDGLASESEFNKGLTELDGGLGALVEGSQAINNGAGELATGGKELSEGAGELSTGANQVADGTKTVRGGWTELQDNVAVLHDGTTQVAEGNQTVKSGWSDLQKGATQLHDGSTQIKDGNQTVESGWRELTVGATDLNDGSTQIMDGNQTVESGWRELTVGATDLNDGSTQIKDGNQIVESGWRELTAGATDLNDGSGQIKDGTSTVKTGWNDLTDGVTQIDGGLLQLFAGSGELHEGLLGGAEESSALDPQEENIDMFASPVMSDNNVVNSFPFYRDANAPYVLTLALFVGILAMSFIVSYTRPTILPPSAAAWFMGKVGVLATLAIAQALIISLYSLIILRLEVHSSLQFISFSIFVSLTFLMIVLFLVALAGNIGRFIALIFAVLQLSTTGSDLPIHMLPEGLRNLSVFLPFTYSIDGFKNIITLGSASSVWKDVGVLSIYLILFGILATIVFLVRFRKIEEEFDKEDDTVTE